MYQNLTPRTIKEEVSPGPQKLKLWQQILLVMGALYVLGLIILYLTGNPNLFPAVVVVGSFVVPVAFVAFFYENKHFSDLTIPEISLSFLYGGVISIYLAAVIEQILLGQLSLFAVFLAGFVEELIKILVVIFLVRGRAHITEINGIIIGAAVGMGFAALESTGYSFTAFLASQGDLSFTVILTLVRALLAPVGHGTWTAIFAGVLFRESAPHRFRLDSLLLATYLGVSLLHGFWNISTVITPSILLGLIADLVIAAISFYILYKLWQEAKMAPFKKDF